MTIVFAVLWILFVGAAVLSLSGDFSASALAAFIGGFIGLSKALLDSLSKENLRFYFFLHRLRIRWQSQAITRWWFAAPLRANIVETTPLAVITEQGENRNQREQERNLSGFPHGVARRGT